MKVLVITTKGEYEEKEINNNLKTLQDIVGGYIEYSSLSQDGIDMILNEEGKIMDLDYNLKATLLYRATHLYADDYIVGDVVIVGTNNQGENRSLKDIEISVVKRIIEDELKEGEE